ncbi:MFS transporter [Microlunatus flavus]|uniref:MFS transporter, SET family, sugar efflux transporter n=1 Tax=Microlunatus flavus TaxID=1036181 RepID=A0A1H9C1A4_9ACTN|nr:MFS transporter [Microlunatus flavus]SEP94593.1 MFS transporter, SET family, sugar efflux transporter [Microlunatus flavus]
MWRDRFHRSALLALFFSGMATSVAMPQLTTFFVTDLGATLPQAGLYYLTNVTAPVVGFALGRLSDRQDDRLTLFRVGAVVGAVGWLAMGLSTQLWMPFVVSVLALGVAGAAGAQVYAAVRDELSRRPSSGDAEVISTVRMGFTFGWVVGPVLGSVVGGAFGLRTVLFVTAALAALQLVPMIGVKAPRHVREAVSGAPPVAALSRRASRRALLPLLAFCGLGMVACSGDTVKFAYLPLYMSEQLHLPALTRGAVIGLQPVCELLLMPLAAALAARYGGMRVVMVGTVCSVLAHLAYATSTSVVGLIVAQLLLSAMWAALAGLGVTVAQDLYPEGVGLASSTFMSSIVFASTVGGLVGSAFVARLGVPHVFVVPAVLSALALVGMAVLARRIARRTVALPVEEPAAASA